MDSEARLKEKVAAGYRAAQVIGNSAVMQALDELRQGFITKWVASPVGAAEEKDELHRMVKVVDGLIQRMTREEAEGRRAAERLQEMKNGNK